MPNSAMTRDARRAKNLPVNTSRNSDPTIAKGKLTNAELRHLIFSDETAKAEALSGDDEACAERLKAIAPADVLSLRVTYLGIAERVGIAPAVRLIVSMNAQAADETIGPLVTEIRHLLRSGNGIDVGDEVIRNILDAFAGNGDLEFTSADAAAIKALAERPARITTWHVARALDALRRDGTPLE